LKQESLRERRKTGGTGEWGMTANGYRFWREEDENILKLDCGDG
jgi:hypothetical protein